VFVHWGVILLTKDALQNSSMALAATVSKGVKVAVMFAMMGSLLPSLQGRQNGVFLLKMLVASGAMAAAILLAVKGFSFMDADGATGLVRQVMLAIKIGCAGAAGLAVFAGAVFALKMEETSMVWALIKKRRPLP
jgi:hypothetical protein